MKKIFKDFIVFIFLTSFFFSILLFLNGEKFTCKDLKLIFDVDAGASCLSKKNIIKREYQKNYLYVLFLLLVIFLFLIVVKLLFSLKHDCEVYEICSCEKNEIHEDESKSEKVKIDNKFSLSFVVSNSEFEKNSSKIRETDNEIDALRFKMKGQKTKSNVRPQGKIDQDYRYDKKNEFQVANFSPNEGSNRSLLQTKEVSLIQKKLAIIYGIKTQDEEEFSTIFNNELKAIKSAKKQGVFDAMAKDNAFISIYKEKEDLMLKNEQINESLKQEAEKLNGYANIEHRENEKEMTKEKIALYNDKETKLIKELDNNGKNALDLEKCKEMIIEIILQIMIKGFIKTKNEAQNFESFCSRYYKKGGNKKKEEILSKFKYSDDEKMEKNVAEEMYDEFYFLIQKGIYFPFHEIANFHNLSLKVLTMTTDGKNKKFINPDRNIKLGYETAGEAINKLQEKIYCAVELNKREKELAEKNAEAGKTGCIIY